MTPLGLATLAAITLLNTSQVPPRQPQTAAPPGRGVISGSLVDAGRGTPVRKATIRLVRTPPGVAKTTTSDSEGRFTFAELPQEATKWRRRKRDTATRVYGASNRSAESVAITWPRIKRSKNCHSRARWRRDLSIVTAIRRPDLQHSGQGTPIQLRNGERMFLQWAMHHDDRGGLSAGRVLPGNYSVKPCRGTRGHLSAQANRNGNARHVPTHAGARQWRLEARRLRERAAWSVGPLLAALQQGVVPVYCQAAQSPQVGPCKPGPHRRTPLVDFRSTSSKRQPFEEGPWRRVLTP